MKPDFLTGLSVVKGPTYLLKMVEGKRIPACRIVDHRMFCHPDLYDDIRTCEASELEELLSKIHVLGTFE